MESSFFQKGDKISDQNNHFGLPSNKTLPTILEMKPSENDVIKLIENIKFQISLANDRLLTFSFSQTKLEIFMKHRSTHTTSLYA